MLSNNMGNQSTESTLRQGLSSVPINPGATTAATIDDTVKFIKKQLLKSNSNDILNN